MLNDFHLMSNPTNQVSSIPCRTSEEHVGYNASFTMGYDSAVAIRASVLDQFLSKQRFSGRHNNFSHESSVSLYYRNRLSTGLKISKITFNTFMNYLYKYHIIYLKPRHVYYRLINFSTLWTPAYSLVIFSHIVFTSFPPSAPTHDIWIQINSINKNLNL